MSIEIKKDIAKDSLKLTISQVLTLAISMLNVMLLSRFRTVEEYGTYSQMIMVSTLIFAFFSSGFAQCINYFLAGEVEQLKKSYFIKTYYAILTSCGVVGGIISIIAIPLIARYFGNSIIADYWFFLLIYPVSRILNDGADRFFIIYHKTNQLVLYRLRYGVTSVSIAILAIILNLTFKTYLVILCICELVFALLIYFFIYKITSVVPFGFNAKYCKQIFVIAIPLGVSALLSIINKELDKLVIGGLTNTATLALYTNVAKELPISVFSTSISTVVMPFIVRDVQNNRKKEAIDVWNNSIRLSALIMCFFIVAFFTYAPQVISVLYSDKYLDGTWIFRVYLFAELFRLTYYGMILNAEGKSKLILYSSLGTMVVNTILDFVLYKCIGLSGPAWATVISVAVMNILQLLFTKKHLGYRFREIYPLLFIGKCLLLNSLLAIPFFFFQKILFAHLLINQNLLTILLGIIWCGFYFLLVRRKLLFYWRKLNN